MHGPGRRSPRQATAQRGVERQELGELRQGCQVEARHAQSGMAHAASRTATRVAECHRRQPQPAGGRKAERRRGNFGAIAALRPTQPAMDLGQGKLGKIGSQPCLHIGQSEVRRGRAQAGAVPLKPQAQRPQTAHQLQRRRYPNLRQSEVGVADFGIEFPVPQLQLADVAAQEFAARDERRGNLRRRHRRQAEAMDGAIAVEPQIDFIQLQFGGAALFVQPGDGGVAHEHLALCQQPVSESAAGAVLRLHCNAGYPEHAGGVAFDFERRRVDRQRLEAQLGGQQRQPRQRGRNLVERQCRLSVCAKDPDVHEAHFRPIALPASGDRTDRHALPHGARNRLRDRLAILVDMGQHQIAQSDDQREETQPRDQDRIGRDAIGPERTVLEKGETGFEKHGVDGALCLGGGNKRYSVKIRGSK